MRADPAPARPDETDFLSDAAIERVLLGADIKLNEAQQERYDVQAMMFDLKLRRESAGLVQPSGDEVNSNTRYERYEAFTAVMGSVDSLRNRMESLNSSQRIIEFEASEKSPELLAAVRAEHDAELAARDVISPDVPPRSGAALNNTVAERYEAFTSVMGSVESQRERMAGLTENQRFAEFEASEQSPERLAEVRAEHDAARSTLEPARPGAALSNNVAERYEAFTSVMGSVESQRERMAGLTENQRFAEFEASEQSPERLAQVRAEHDGLTTGDPQPSAATVTENTEAKIEAYKAASKALSNISETYSLIQHRQLETGSVPLEYKEMARADIQNLSKIPALVKAPHSLAIVAKNMQDHPEYREGAREAMQSLKTSGFADTAKLHERLEHAVEHQALSHQEIEAMQIDYYSDYEANTTPVPEQKAHQSHDEPEM